MLRLTEAHSDATAIFIEETYPSRLKSCLDSVDRFQRYSPPLFLEVDHGREPEVGRIRELRLRHFKERTSSSTLSRSHFINIFY